jgi:hypothetical protein
VYQSAAAIDTQAGLSINRERQSANMDLVYLRLCLFWQQYEHGRDMTSKPGVGEGLNMPFPLKLLLLIIAIIRIIQEISE